MTPWKQVSRVSLTGIAYNGPAWVRTAEDKRGLYSSILTAVIPIEAKDEGFFLPFIHGIDTGGNRNFHSSERAYGTLKTAKREITLRLQAQSGDYEKG